MATLKHKDSWFAFYNKHTDELVCCGSYDFCIQQLHIAESSFRKVLSRAKSGKHQTLVAYENEIEPEGIYMNRNLDGAYFRIERDGKWQTVCFSDLTKEERKVLVETGPASKWNVEGWKTLAFHLADQLQQIGEICDIVGE